MNRPAAKEETTSRRVPSLAQRTSGPARSYLQTRVRASRLLNAARVLVFLELSRRLHHAYAQAYDKQASDWLLPKNLTTAISDARNVIQNASGDCAKLLGQDALSRFDAIAGNIQVNGDILVHVEGLGGGVREGRLSEVPATDAVTVGNQISLNPQGWSFNTYTRGGQAYHPLQSTFQRFGVTQAQYAAAVIIHEFLHTTGKFKPDSKVGLDGKIDSKKSREYQKKVLEACFPKKK